MGFKERSSVADLLIGIVRNHFWDSNELQQSLYHADTGYETQVAEEMPKDIRESLRKIRENETVRHIRFVPDCLIVDRGNPNNVYYLEYKCTQTIGRSKDLGQIELDAYDNYVALQSIGVRVAVLNYVAYHDRLLLCDFIENIEETYRSKGLTQTDTGSGTPFVNTDLTGMRTLLDFLVGTHGINRESITQNFDNARAELESKLPKKRRQPR